MSTYLAFAGFSVMLSAGLYLIITRVMSHDEGHG